MSTEVCCRRYGLFIFYLLKSQLLRISQRKIQC